MNKSASSEPVDARIPPPVPLRSMTYVIDFDAFNLAWADCLQERGCPVQRRSILPTHSMLSHQAMTSHDLQAAYRRWMMKLYQALSNGRHRQQKVRNTPSTSTDHLFLRSEHVTRPVSSTEDDAEVANSFPNDNLPTPTASPLHLSMVRRDFAVHCSAYPIDCCPPSSSY